LTWLVTRRSKEGVPPSARLALIGTLELDLHGAAVRVPSSAQRLLAFAALRRRPLARGYVAGQLWLDSTGDRAAASLRSALWRLHRAAGDVVWASAREVGLSPWVEVDVDAIGAAAHAVLAGEPAHPADVAALTASGDLLPDWYDEWIAVDRERLRQLRVHALEALCQRWTAERRFGEALEAGLAAVQAEPLRESAHRALIGMHLAEGNVVEAVRQYETCKRLMARELGVRPSRLMVGLLDGAAPRARHRLGTA
jgi:DNA-binding SARP family transcriptional activator